MSQSPPSLPAFPAALVNEDSGSVDLGADPTYDPDQTRPVDEHASRIVDAAPSHQGLVAGRYELHEVLGRGGFGEVFASMDRITGERCALKLLHPAAPGFDRQARLEVAALRWLSLPGVVRLRDSGHWGGRVWLAMDLVEGVRFPTGPTPWAELAPLLRRLLETVARLHANGVLHLDLKPHNVLVDPSGRPWVLDFGLARGRALTAEARTHGASVPWAAPEQILGRPVDERTDLYAVGVMAFHALTGAPPTLDRERALVGLPEEAVAFCLSLLEPAPQDRPASAQEACTLLGKGDGLAIWGVDEALVPTERCQPADLAPLFEGPDAFLRLQSDAAAALWHRTGGWPHRVRRELAGWLEAGLAQSAGGRVRVRRLELGRLQSGLPVIVRRSPARCPVEAAVRASWPGLTAEGAATATGLDVEAAEAELLALEAQRRVWRVAGLWTAGAAVGEAPPEAVATVARASQLRSEGREPEAFGLLEQLLRAAQLGDRRRDEAEVLDLWVRWSFDASDPSSLQRASYELGRRQVESAHLEALEQLVAARRHALDGERQRSRALLREIPPLHDEDLEVLRLATRVAAVDRDDQEELARVLADIRRGGRLTSPVNLARLRSWEGILAYRRQAYDEAIRLEGEALAAAPKELVTFRLGVLANLAYACLDGLDLEQAERLGAALMEKAARVRSPRFEGQGWHVWRSALYRQRRWGPPALDAVEGAAAVGRETGAIVAFVEATHAWRTGFIPEARDLAETAARFFGTAGWLPGAVVARALATACGGAHPQSVEAEWAQAQAFPGLALQAAALHRLAGLSAPPADLWRQAAGHRPPHHHDVPLDVLSLGECVRLLCPNPQE